MIVVADTTPLSELAKIGRLEILRDIFGGVSHFAPSQKSKVSQCGGRVPRHKATGVSVSVSDVGASPRRGQKSKGRTTKINLEA